MTNLDQFESIFNAATHEVFRYQPVAIRTVLVITDLDEEGAAAFSEHCQKLLGVLGPDVVWSHLSGTDYEDCDQLLARLKEQPPDLICSYRNLKSQAFRWPYSLGVFLNVLLRQVEPPVVVLPHPETDRRYEWAGVNTDRVLVITDHLTGDADLVNWGAAFCQPKGTLYLSHVEDDAVFARYMDIISKLPDIPTDVAREQIAERLLEEPADYIDSVRKKLTKALVDVEVVPLVKMGHRVEDYQALVEEHECDLLVFRTRQPENTRALALRGAAYSLALEVRKVPLLML